jgi:putative hydrolase of the HAD superfamily
MILTFDLDDTLYAEATYVDSGLSAVARHGMDRWGWDADVSLATLRSVIARDGRGKVFDHWLAGQGAWSRRRVQECVKVYRHHRPRLELFPAAKFILERYRSNCPLYLVTDGHKIVQRNKVDALDLWGTFQRVLITHRFGRAAAKPSTLCFERILAAEKGAWSDLVYIGDNPAKDFVSLNARGAFTVRVLTGCHAGTAANPGHDGAVTIPDLAGLPAVLAARFPAFA